MLVFTNNGLIPEAAITTMGVNAKINDNPIGQFGTGLKYAIAIILRLGGEVKIIRGFKVLEFGLKSSIIRGQEFRIVTLNGRPLGFTDQLGLNWEPWMAYRELASNVRDEGGVVRVWDGESSLEGAKNTTTVIVDCPDIEKAHYDRHSLFLTTEPLFSLPGVAVHPGESEYIFYRGIRVMKLQKKSLYTYNFTKAMSLTEDRTLLYPSLVPHVLAENFVQSSNLNFLSVVLNSDRAKDHLEVSLPYSNVRSTTPSDQFMEMCDLLKEQKKLVGMASKVYHHYADTMPGYRSPYLVDLTPIEEEVLKRAMQQVANAGIPIDRDGLFFKSKLEMGRVQVAGRRKMTIDYKVLQQGEKALALVLIEGAAYLSGGSSAEQLSHFILHRKFIPEELTEGYSARSTRDEYAF
jgi:hypothetical protein